MIYVMTLTTEETRTWNASLQIAGAARARFARCSCSVAPVTRMSSRYTQTRGIPWRRFSITLWKMDGGDAIPNGSLVFREGLASRERGVELFNAGNGIPLAFGGSVDSYLVVTAYPHSSVALPDGNYGRGPVRELHRSQNSKKYL